ncbi:hypothetical protein [Gaoshiqia sp. Z1-71]|uniref:hypothetical protein n=1 Tax=Gaoshiqia hydrogeniformans TaxID=3290090 RepID=UPI003BF833C4
MENFKHLQPISDLIKANGHSISESLTKCYRLIAHTLPLDEWDNETQTALYDLSETIEALKPIEDSLLPPENEKIKELTSMLQEVENEKIYFSRMIEEKQKQLELKEKYIETLQKHNSLLRESLGLTDDNTEHMRIINGKKEHENKNLGSGAC